MPESKSVLLVAHGSRDPRAADSARALARAVAALRPRLDVRVAFLEHHAPRPAQALRVMGPGTVVVPLLLTNAFHGTVDLPGQVAGFDCHIAETLGSVSEPLLCALEKRLPSTAFDGVVLAAAGTTHTGGQQMVQDVAAALSDRLSVPCRVAYAAGATPTAIQAISTLHDHGAHRIVVASYFLAPGRLYDLIAGQARDAGAVAVAAPLGASWHLARLIVERVDAAPVSTNESAPAHRPGLARFLRGGVGWVSQRL